MGEKARTDNQKVVYKEKSLRLVADELEEVLQLAEEWDELFEDEQIMTALEWSDAMGHLTALEGEHAAGGLSEEQEKRYVALKAELRAALPIIERLSLRSPREVLGE